MSQAAFRFSLGVRLADPSTFFGRRPGDESALAERSAWFASDRRSYLQWMPTAGPVVEAAATALRGWEVDIPSNVDTESTLLSIGCATAADVLLLHRPDDAPGFAVVAGCVCFPTRWRLSDKLGKVLQQAHAPTPGLNESLGDSIDRLASNIANTRPVSRWNWSVVAAAELNHHPDRDLPSLATPLVPSQVWLRREEQLLARLPFPNALLFGIRITHTPWTELAADRAVAEKLAADLATMPAVVAEYKRIDHVRRELIEMLQRQ